MARVDQSNRLIHSSHSIKPTELIEAIESTNDHALTKLKQYLLAILHILSPVLGHLLQKQKRHSKLMAESTLMGNKTGSYF